MTRPSSTELDLAALLAKGWADRDVFPDTEYGRALEFYQTMRAHDDRLRWVREQASGVIEQWTGRVPRDVGSFGTRLNLETSDLDLGIGYPVDKRGDLMAVRGYEQVLGLEAGTLTGMLEAARIERHGDAWAKRRVHLPTEFVREEPASAPISSRERFQWISSRRTIVAGAVAVVVLATLGGVGLALRHPKPPHRSPAAVVSVRDGSDPKVTGCAAGAATAPQGTERGSWN